MNSSNDQTNNLNIKLPPYNAGIYSLQNGYNKYLPQLIPDEIQEGFFRKKPQKKSNVNITFHLKKYITKRFSEDSEKLNTILIKNTIEFISFMEELRRINIRDLKQLLHNESDLVVDYFLVDVSRNDNSLFNYFKKRYNICDLYNQERCDDYITLSLQTIKTCWYLNPHEITKKAYELAEIFNINIKKPRSISIKKWLNDSPIKYSKNSYTYCQNKIKIIDFLGEQEESLLVCGYDDTCDKKVILPYFAIERYNCNFIVALPPQKKLPLYGLNELHHSEKPYIVLTAWLEEVVVNKNRLEDIILMSWWGGLDTINQVDWSPLENKTVYYLFDSLSNNMKLEFKHLEIIYKKLNTISGLNFVVISRKYVELNIGLFVLYDWLYIEKYTQKEIVNLYNEHKIKCPFIEWDINNSFFNRNQTIKDSIVLFSRLSNAGEITLLYGDSGCGKSTFAWSLGYALSRQYDLSSLHVIGEKAMSVLILCGEMTPEQKSKRILWFEKQFPDKKTNCWIELADMPKGQKLNNKKGLECLDLIINEANLRHSDCAGVSLIIIDNLKTLTSDGDGQAGWQVLFDYMETKRSRKNMTWLVIHHANKGSKHSYGTSNIDAVVDNKIHIYKNPNQDDNWVKGIDSKKNRQEYMNYVNKVIHEKFSGSEEDSFYFFYTIQKCRDLKPSDKHTLLLSMNPEHSHPKWEAINITDPNSSLSYDYWINHRITVPPLSEDEDDGDIEKKYTCDELRKKESLFVKDYLQRTCKTLLLNNKKVTRVRVAAQLGMNIQELGYLMKIKNLKKKDLLPPQK